MKQSLYKYTQDLINEIDEIPVAFIKYIVVHFQDNSTVTIPHEHLTQKSVKKITKIVTLIDNLAIKSYQIFVDVEGIVNYAIYIHNSSLNNDTQTKL
jgi:hypothetical protein